MEKLKREDLYGLEDYAGVRSEFRTKPLGHKQNRKVPIGPNATLYFEDRLTIQYQIQEMLRVERIFERQGIEDELAAYNPLIPDGKPAVITNPITEDANNLRISLVPGVVDTYIRNLKRGATVQDVFEIGKVYWHDGDDFHERSFRSTIPQIWTG